jgi:DNA-binding PadR family transcriptional regulator
MDLSPIAQSILVHLNGARTEPSARTGGAVRVALSLDRHSAYQALEALERDQFVRLRNEIYELTAEGQAAAERIAPHGHAGDEAPATRGEEQLNDPRLRAIFQELAALDANGGVHLRDYFALKYRYPELSAEIDAAMLIQVAQQQRRLELRLDRVEQTVQRIRRDVLLLFSSPVLAAVALLILLAVRG